jgi:hypothetical protein
MFSSMDSSERHFGVCEHQISEQHLSLGERHSPLDFREDRVVTQGM